MKAPLILFLICSGLVFFLAQDLQAQRLVLDTSLNYQLIDGFGGMNHTSWVRDLNEDQRIKAFDNSPGNIGLSILRVHVDPVASRFSEQLPTAQYATMQGAKVLASPWDPPSAMLEYVDDDPRLPYRYYGAYAAHLDSFNTLMQQNGVPLYAISVQNEPDIGEWTSWTPQEILTFVKEFGAEINTRLLAAESFNFNRQYTYPILNDPLALEHVDIIGGHIYGNGLFDYPMAREKGKPVWMTEHLTGSDSPSMNNWNLAMSLGREIHDCMEANFSAYIWWYIRRFYSLIRDDGNISEKGYVMMHFSKFVRPGAIRTGVEVSDAAGLYATAFKTDSSLTIVALNTGSESIDLEIEVPADSSRPFALFSSVDKEFMVNRGLVSADGGSFTIGLDAKSISTITNEAGAGGKPGNLAPVADAGADTSIVLGYNESHVPITLDAGGSYDPDGEIRNYSWAVRGEQLAYSRTLDLNLSAGNYAFDLSVTDNDGARSGDTFTVQIESPYTTDLWFESECGSGAGNWEEVPNSRASNGYFLRAPSGSEAIDHPSEDSADIIRIDFQLDEEGVYLVWGRVLARSANDDSFWVRMDEDEWIAWNGIPTGSDWAWDDVHDGSDENPVHFLLTPGEHSLQICFREDGTWLDKILISNSGIVPTGPGGTADSCPGSLSALSERLMAKLQVYPNPSQGHFKISWDEEISRVEVLSADGHVLYLRTNTLAKKHEEIRLEFIPGLYLLRVSNEDRQVIRQLIIR